MTDRVLGDEDVDVLEGMLNGSYDLRYDEFLELIASHRLQAARIQELEKVIEDATELALQLRNRDYAP